VAPAVREANATINMAPHTLTEGSRRVLRRVDGRLPAAASGGCSSKVPQVDKLEGAQEELEEEDEGVDIWMAIAAEYGPGRC